jgi:hypothetical protein
VFLIVFFLFLGNQLSAQGITYYQYRKVPDAKIDEFIKRETTYWSKVAQKAVDKGKLKFWALFQKVSAGETEHSANFLFVNTFSDIDSAMDGSIWNPAPLFPGIPMSKIETYSLSTVTETMLVKDTGWEQSSKAVPEKDFNFVVFNYNYSSNPDSFVVIEQKYWQPFIKKAMDAQQTNQMAWGNSIILSPVGGSARMNSLSIDLYSTFKGALMPTWNSDLKFPNEALTELGKLATRPRETEIYRVVKVAVKEN